MRTTAQDREDRKAKIALAVLVSAFAFAGIVLFAF